jgi:hypothetical protein
MDPNSERFIHTGESLVCGVDWHSGRWRTPVGVFLTSIDDSRWIGWVYFRVYDIAPLELKAKAQDRLEIVLANENYVIVISDLDIVIRVLDVKAEVEDLASGHCRTLDQDTYSVAITETKED